METEEDILPVSPLPDGNMDSGLNQKEVLSNEQVPVSTTVPSSNSKFFNDSQYPGDLIDDTPEPEGGFKTVDELDNRLAFKHPSTLVCFYDSDIADGYVTLHPWQLKELRGFGDEQPTSHAPYKYCLLASNGSGKDKFIIAPFAIWFALTKVRSRTIITTASGNQLTSQTEPYIKDLAEKVNKFHGCEIFRIRQRYVKCMLTGSEIRMFATDESGKAEGYHPIDARSEMSIIVNEAKSVTEDIHRALRRCTGYNYWLEISSSGEPQGFLYEAYTNPRLKFRCTRITSYDCPQISADEIEQDKILDGEHSPYFRSKHLSLFTSIGGEYIMPIELIEKIKKNPPTFEYKSWPLRVGIDLAAGGDENVIFITQGNKFVSEYFFREEDTTLGSLKIAEYLKDNQIPKNHPHIYADDGGIGRGIIFNLIHKDWHINRIMNQWAALGDKKQFGNRGAENWYRIKRIIEEGFFNLSGFSSKCLEQLYTRKYKQNLNGGRMILESKKEAIAHGRPSPDRADAFILSLTGLTVEDFIKASPSYIEPTKLDKRPKDIFTNQDEAETFYDEKVTYGDYDENQKPAKGRFRTLHSLVNN